MSTSVPLPGQHLPSSGGVDPADVHDRVGALLGELDDAGDDYARQAQILERAHDVLVESLAAVDKV